MAKLSIEIADTPFSLGYGLMHRKDLDDESGMLFKFPNITEAQFWGKNTYIPLDVAFILNNEITSIKNIVPMSNRLIHSDGFCHMAVEANAGYFDRHGIKPGSIIDIQGDIVEFKNAKN